MSRIAAQSTQAQEALKLVSQLQQAFVERLESLAASLGVAQGFERVEWLREQGRFGGGLRFESGGNGCFNRASVNVSQVHYESDPHKQMNSATALSTIVHPHNPFAPSLHMHISWTELKSGKAYWRLMADLNPAIETPGLRQTFETALEALAPELYPQAKAQGEKYFYIPSLGRHRGISHYYLEDYFSNNPQADLELADKLGQSVIETYAQLLQQAYQAYPRPQAQDFARQLTYHSLYFLQVLTLDRGTSAGLLVHNQNDQGILGSLPASVDRELLSSWLSLQPAPQHELLAALIEALPQTQPAAVDRQTKLALAEVIRAHYLKHPLALSQQASGFVVPPTLANHGKKEMENGELRVENGCRRIEGIG